MLQRHPMFHNPLTSKQCLLHQETVKQQISKQKKWHAPDNNNNYKFIITIKMRNDKHSESCTSNYSTKYNYNNSNYVNDVPLSLHVCIDKGMTISKWYSCINTAR